MSKNVNELLDFSDLDERIEFKYKEDMFCIPAFTKKQLDTLMAISKRFVADAPKGEEVETENMSEEDMERSKNFFNMQDEYLIAAVSRIDENILVPLTQDDIDSWPIRLKNKIMSLINNQMSSTISEAGGEAEKKS